MARAAAALRANRFSVAIADVARCTWVLYHAGRHCQGGILAPDMGILCLWVKATPLGKKTPRRLPGSASRSTIRA